MSDNTQNFQSARIKDTGNLKKKKDNTKEILKIVAEGCTISTWEHYGVFINTA
jgi:hypothetical protein